MSLISTVLDRVKPVEVYKDPQEKTEDKMKGYADPQYQSYAVSKFFDGLKRGLQNNNRVKFLKSVHEMTNDFGIADVALEQLCNDATAKPISIDAPARRRRIIEDLLKTVQYERYRSSWLYGMLAYGDLFLQKMYQESSKPGRFAFTSGLMKLPVTSMIRNTNERDEFYSRKEAFYQVDHISSWPNPITKIPFAYPKILHARTDHGKSEFFRYGRSIYHSCVRVWNMTVMEIEDAAIQRHQSTQSVLWHLVGRHSEARPGEAAIKQYSHRVAEQFNERTTQMFVDGATELEHIGGTKSVIGSVDDLRLMLSILSLCLRYPLDLGSVGINNGSGGEELFRKEVVLKRTCENMLKREESEILRPLIDTELELAGAVGKYNIIAFPASFEDANKRSKRGLMEVEQGVKSWQTYHEENNQEISFEEEKRRVESDLEWKRQMGIPSSSNPMRSDPAAGEHGATGEPTDQQERVTPGVRGVSMEE